MDRFTFDDLYVRRLTEHDPETEAHFNQYFRAVLFVKLRKRLADTRDIEDVIQETFRRALAGIDKLRDGRKLGAFMAATCHHTLLERYRERKAEPLAGAHENIPASSNIEEEFINEETAAYVRLVISHLSTRDAMILRAVFLGSESKDEVCRRLGIDRKYLRVVLHRAKERFSVEYRRKRKPPFFP